VDGEPPLRIVIVGGGVAGVSCTEAIVNCISSLSNKLLKNTGNYHITLVSSDGQALKHSEAKDDERAYDVSVTVLQSHDVVRWLEEKAGSGSRASLKFVQGTVTGVNVDARIVTVECAHAIGGCVHLPYSKLCLCTGSSPKRLLESPEVVTVRDTDSVAGMAAMLARFKGNGRQPKIMVVGNGGIALDLVAGVRGVDVCWVVRHTNIGDAFFDGECGAFLEEEMWGLREGGGAQVRGNANVSDGRKTLVAPTSSTKQPLMGGASVGPAWAAALASGGDSEEPYGELVIHKECEVLGVRKLGDLCEVELSNGTVISDVSLIISAIGVDPTPNVAWLPHEIKRAPDGGILVDVDMRTSCDDIFAAGDACTVGHGNATPGNSHTTWFQMRLWSQARSMGIRAAHCILGVEDQMASDLAFDLFTHATTFLGKRVILLGSFNGQALDTGGNEGNVTLYSRVEGTALGRRSFVRVVIQGGKVKGAICIGETGLSEVLENLIMDGLDVSSYGADILSHQLDLDDLFD
jgi:NADPH-dependent 2,4-dienoyl-CoA reductase/sulfur reductase-like enzyme